MGIVRGVIFSHNPIARGSARVRIILNQLPPALSGLVSRGTPTATARQMICTGFYICMYVSWFQSSAIFSNSHLICCKLNRSHSWINKPAQVKCVIFMLTYKYEKLSRVTSTYGILGRYCQPVASSRGCHYDWLISKLFRIWKQYLKGKTQISRTMLNHHSRRRTTKTFQHYLIK